MEPLFMYKDLLLYPNAKGIKKYLLHWCMDIQFYSTLLYSEYLVGLLSLIILHENRTTAGSAFL
jgi:hypothetical protein